MELHRPSASKLKGNEGSFFFSFPRAPARTTAAIKQISAIMARSSRLGAVIFPGFISSSPWTSHARLSGNKLKVFSCWLVPLLGLLCGGLCGAESDFSILEEAQVLAVQMKKLSAQELGVFTMQVNKHFCTPLTRFCALKFFLFLSFILVFCCV